jgi:hypothetical protein
MTPIKASFQDREPYLEPRQDRLLNATHCLLNLMNPQLAGDSWVYLCSGPLHYVAAMVNPLSQSMHDATPNSTSTKFKVSNIQLSQRAPNCIYNSGGNYTVGDWLLANVPKFKTIQPPPLDVQKTDHGAAA